MNVLKELVKDVEREFAAENLDTVFEAIGRIGKADGPIIKSLFGTEDRGVSRESLQLELSSKEQHEPKFFGRQILGNIGNFFMFIRNCSMSVKILIASIVFP